MKQTYFICSSLQTKSRVLKKNPNKKKKDKKKIAQRHVNKHQVFAILINLVVMKSFKVFPTKQIKYQLICNSALGPVS